MSARQPDWDVDKARGEEAEALYRALRRHIMNGTAEVKCDDRAAETGNIYVEYACQTAQGWKPSGIATTKATTWVIFADPILLAMPTWVLRNLARDAKDQGHTRECIVGSHPTRGVVLPMRDLADRAWKFWTAGNHAQAA